MHPLRSKTTYTETLDGELCVYEWTRHEVHALNASAASVWQWCDGNTSVEEMAARLRAARLPYADQLVALALEEFERKHLLDANRTPSRTGRAMSRRALVRCGVAAALVPVVTSIVAPTALQAQSPGGATGTQTFAFTGSPATFVVPSGITSLTVSAFGAQGSSVPTFVRGSARGGLGGSVTATLAVTPGETLGLNVGGLSPSSNPGAAAFNGGGPGGVAAAAGGGASDVRRGGGALSNRVIVAGGGGGTSGFPTRAGGDGGGTTAASGEAEVQSGAGGGGTQIAGGAGGTVPGSIEPPGTAGALGMGGAGSGFFGGGGGGGYFGGGGGASWGANLGGGGGGGSSFADPSATAVVHLQGVRFGTGLIILSW